MEKVELQRLDLGTPIFFRIIDENILRLDLQNCFLNLNHLDPKKEINNFFEKYPNKLKLISHSDPKLDCIDFAFQSDPNYKLTLKRFDLDNHDTKHTLTHLLSHSYIQVLSPEQNDIAIYYCQYPNNHTQVKHYGIVNSDRSITHKFGNFDIFQSITPDIVPNCYGNRITFVRKINQSFL